MAVGHENHFAANFSREMRAVGGMVYPLVASQYAPSGWPDKLLVHRRWTGLLELKSDATVVRPAQRVVHRELRKRRPGVNYVVRRDGDDDRCVVEDEEGTELARCDVRSLPWVLEGLREGGLEV